MKELSGAGASTANRKIAASNLESSTLPMRVLLKNTVSKNPMQRGQAWLSTLYNVTLDGTSVVDCREPLLAITKSWGSRTPVLVASRI